MLGDETIVPHNGKRAGKLRQIVLWKPHSTDLKRYCLADGLGPYVMDMYLYIGKCGVLNNRLEEC